SEVVVDQEAARPPQVVGELLEVVEPPAGGAGNEEERRPAPPSRLEQMDRVSCGCRGPGRVPALVAREVARGVAPEPKELGTAFRHDCDGSAERRSAVESNAGRRHDLLVLQVAHALVEPLGTRRPEQLRLRRPAERGLHGAKERPPDYCFFVRLLDLSLAGP